jgi:hypothetical protein
MLQVHTQSHLFASFQNEKTMLQELNDAGVELLKVHITMSWRTFLCTSVMSFTKQNIIDIHPQKAEPRNLTAVQRARER